MLSSNTCVKLALFSLLTLSAVPAFSQSCAEVYKDAVRDVSFTRFDLASLHAVYDHQCRSSSSSAGGSLESSVGLLVEMIPIDFTLGASGSKEKIENFCKTYREIRESKIGADIKKSTVVTEALSSFNECKRIEQAAQVVISHASANPDSVAVFFKFLNTNTVLRIEGVAAREFECRHPIPQGALSSNALTPTSKFEMRQSFTILCTRDGDRSEGGTTYEPGTVTIATTVGSYTLGMPSDTVYSHHLASEATATITGLRESNRQLLERNSELQNLAGRKVITLSLVESWAQDAGAKAWIPCRSDENLAARDMCEKAKGTLAGPLEVVGSTGGGSCGFTFFAFSCLVPSGE